MSCVRDPQGNIKAPYAVVNPPETLEASVSPNMKSFMYSCYTSCYTNHQSFKNMFPILLMYNWYTDIPHFIVLSFFCALQILHLFQIEGLWQPCIKKIYRCHFSNSNYFVFLCHILIIPIMFQTLSLLVYLLW